MFRQITQKILVQNKTYLSIRPFLHPQNYAFGSKKIFTPMMPVIGDNSAIYVNQNYAEGKIIKKRSLVTFTLPAIILSIHSYLT